MEYKISADELGSAFICDALRALYKAYQKIGAELYVVGATARDIGCLIMNIGPVPRKTCDLDVAVSLEDWKEYDKLSEVLLETGFTKAPQKQRFSWHIEKAGFDMEIDVVPFGSIASGDSVAWPPDGNPQMSVKGFKEIMSHADTVIIDEDLKIMVAPLSGQWFLKYDAWRDRHLRTTKDAADMQFFLENAYVAYALASDTIPEDVSIEADTFDLTVAGAEWIASDVSKVLSESNRLEYSSYLGDEVIAGVESELLCDLYDKSLHSRFDSIRRALYRMSVILRKQA